MPTYSPKSSEIQRAWFVIDAEGLVLGRVATEVARILGRDGAISVDEGAPLLRGLLDAGALTG